jgi:hypothetical protein
MTIYQHLKKTPHRKTIAHATAGYVGSSQRNFDNPSPLFPNGRFINIHFTGDNANFTLEMTPEEAAKLADALNGNVFVQNSRLTKV